MECVYVGGCYANNVYIGGWFCFQIFILSASLSGSKSDYAMILAYNL